MACSSVGLIDLDVYFPPLIEKERHRSLRARVFRWFVVVVSRGAVTFGSGTQSPLPPFWGYFFLFRCVDRVHFIRAQPDYCHAASVSLPTRGLAAAIT